MTLLHGGQMPHHLISDALS